MASFLTLLLFFVVLFNKIFIREIDFIPSSASLLPDLTIGTIGGLAIVHLVITGRWAKIPIKYFLVLLGFVYVGVIGVVVNDVSGDTIFAGVRTYLRAIPFFLLPIAYAFSPKDVSLHLKCFFVMLIVQIPVTTWQRFFLFANEITGDNIRGTFGTSTTVTFVGSASIIVVAAMYLDKRIKFVPAVVMGLLLLIPAMLCETKITPILLGLGFLGLLWSRRGVIGTAQLTQLGVAGVILIGSFIAVYDQLYLREDVGGYVDIMSDTDRIIKGYTLTGAEAKSLSLSRRQGYKLVDDGKELLLQNSNRVGRFDSLKMPFYSLFPQEMARLLTGLGMANTTSTFGSGGDYLFVTNELGGATTSVSLLIWETGLLGALLFLTFIVLVIGDAYRVSKGNDMLGTLGAALLGVGIIFLYGQFHANLFFSEESLLLFAYLAGVLVAHERLQQPAVQPMQPIVYQRRARGSVS